MRRSPQKNTRRSPERPDPRLFTKSTITDAYYYRHPTDGVIGPDRTTWVPPQTAPTAPRSSLAAPGPVPSASTDSGRGSCDTHTRDYAPHRRPYSPSPPRYREYEHEYGPRNGGHGRRSGPQHYHASRYRSRSPQAGPSSRSPRYDHGDRSCGQGTHRSQAPAARSAPANSGAPANASAPVNADARVDASTRTSTNAAAPTTPIHRPDITTAELDNRDTQCSRLAMKREKKRLRGVAKKSAPLQDAAARPPPADRDADALGIWFGLGVVSLGHSTNLLRWSASGDKTSRRFVLHIEQEYAQLPALKRSEGVAHILGQQAASRAYEIATAREASPFANSDYPAQTHIQNTGSPSAPSAPPPTPSDDNAPVIASYLGAGLAGGDEAADFPTTAMSVGDAVTFFELTNTADWPKAMRNVLGEFPTKSFERPLELDVRSHLTLLHLSPENDGSILGVLANAQFTEQAMLLFSAEGMFARHVIIGGLRYAVRAVHEHYNYSTSNLAFSHIASWFVGHGIAANSNDDAALESFARSFHNRIAGNKDPTNATFTDWPYNASSTATILGKDITKWIDLEHAPLRPGLASLQPHRPASPNARLPSPTIEDDAMVGES
ncbi:hypothetical protein C8R44DRAFT_887775 [Mycena epipterygia]|nr:hypothetical protein C8R44DRAFT_887775 [Mycena epipterygia]